MNAPPRWKSCLAAAWPYLLLLLLVVIFFGDSLFGGKAFLLRDTFCDFLPYRALQKRAFWSGHLPLWNPYSGGGQTFVGDPQCAALYPLHLIFDLLTLAKALNISLCLHVYLAAAGCYALLRKWGCGIWPAMIAAVACALGTCPIAWMEYLYAICVLAWVPWVLLLAERIAEKTSADETRSGRRECFLNFLKSAPAISALAIILAVQYFGGNTELISFSGMILAAYAVCCWPLIYGWRTALRAWQGLAVAAIIAVLITSPDWLLLAQRVTFSVRQSGFDPAMPQGSIHPMHWLTFVLPYLFGRAGFPDKYWAKTVNEYWLGACYVGIVPLVLALTALIAGWHGTVESRSRPRRVRLTFLAAMLVAGLFLAAGQYTPIFPLVHKFVPGFTRMRWPSKTLVFVHYALVLLAGFGAQRLMELNRQAIWKRDPAWWSSVILSGAIAVILAMLLLFSGSPRDGLFQAMTFHLAEPIPWRVTDFTSQLFAAMFIGLGAVIAVVLLAIRRIPPRVGMAAMLLVTYADLFYISRQVHPIGPASVYEFPLSVAERVVGEPSILKRVHSNYAPLQQVLYARSDLLAWEIAKSLAAGNSWLNFDISSTWAGGLTMERQQTLFGLFTRPQFAERAADLFAVTHVIARTPVPGIWQGEEIVNVRGFTHPTGLPRALLLPYWIGSKSLDNSLRLILDPQFDPHFLAVLEPDESGAAPPPHDADMGAIHGGIDSIKYDFDHVTIRYNSDRHALLLLNDAWYPGWKARLDGKATPIYQANALFRGVMVDAGSHELRFDYEPWQFRVGMILSGAALVAMIAFCALSIARRKSLTQ